MKKAILFIPGVGRGEKVNGPAKIMAERLGLPYKILDWQSIIESESDERADLHCSYGGRLARWIRKKFWDYCYEAVVYEQHKDEILDLMQKEMIKFKNNKYDEIIIISHSWGTLIAYDYLTLSMPRHCSLVTMASPIPFAKKSYSCSDAKKWINLYERSDPIAHKLFLPNVKDIRVNTGFKGMTPLSHISYFKSKKCAKVIKKELGL